MPIKSKTEKHTHKSPLFDQETKVLGIFIDVSRFIHIIISSTYSNKESHEIFHFLSESEMLFDFTNPYILQQ